MLKNSKAKIYRTVLLGQIFSSIAMEKLDNNIKKHNINNISDKSIEIEGNKIDKTNIFLEVLEEKLNRNIKKLPEILKINETYNTTDLYYTDKDELKKIKNILNNLNYSHQYKFNTEKGIEELKCIYGILCEKILKLSTYLYYTDKEGNVKSNKEIIEKILNPLIEREKTIAKNNHFEIDFFMKIIYVNISI